MLRWVEVDLGSIGSNARYVRRTVGRNVKIIAVVKADAYGHGAVPSGKAMLKNGADMLAVANIDEAEELRRGGIKAAVLILNYTPHERFREVLANRFSQTIFDLKSAKNLSLAARKAGRTAKVHIKVDTGMGRLGVMPEEAVCFARKIAELPNIRIEGIFSHLSSAGDDRKYTKEQYKKFKDILDKLAGQGIRIPLIHISNSIATLAYPRMRLTAVRPGIMLYGISPWGTKRKCAFLKPAMSLKARIVSLKEVGKGASISYGRTFRTKRRSLIAVIPVGYAQGYARNLSNRSSVIIRGKRVPVAGRICMDQSLVDVTGISKIKVGDEVVLFGRQGREEIRAEELAGWYNTIGYEVVTTVGMLVPRIYIK